MKKLIKFILSLSLFFFGFSQINAFDIISSPTDNQNGIEKDGLVLSLNYNVNAYDSFLIKDSSGTLINSGALPYEDFNDSAYGCVNSISFDYEYSGIYFNNQYLIKIKGCSYTSNPSVYWYTNYYFLYNRTTNTFVELTGVFFLGNNFVILDNGLNLMYYQYFDDLTLPFNLLQTLPYPSGYITPKTLVDYYGHTSLPDVIDYLQILSGDGVYWYLGADDLTHYFRGTFSTPLSGILPFPDNPNGLLTYPLFSFYQSGGLNGPFTLFGGGNNQIYVWENTTLDDGTVGIFDTGSFLETLSFSNPKVYFKSTDTQTYSWDLNCQTSGFSSCRLDLNDSKYYCANDSGTKSPNGEVCNNPVLVSFTPPPTSSDSSGYVPTTSSGYTYEPLLQDCSFPVTFSGSQAGLSKVNSTGGLLVDCNFRQLDLTNQFGSQYKDLKVCATTEGNICDTFETSCLSSITDYSYYFKSDTIDIIKYDCNSGANDTGCKNPVSCSWSDKNTCGPSSQCYIDGDYCKVKKEYECMKTTFDDNTTKTTGSLWETLIGGVTKAVNSVKDTIGNGLNNFKNAVGDGLNSLGDSISNSIDGIKDLLSDSGAVGDFSTGGVLNGWGSFSGAVGTGGGGSITGSISSYSGVISDTNYGTGLDNKYCKMFDSNGNFIYYNNGPGFTLSLNTSGLINNGFIHDYILVYLDKLINMILSPINNVLTIIRSFSFYDDNTNVCFLGTVQNIEYQSLLNGTQRLSGALSIQKGTMTFMDYIVLLAYGFFVISYLSFIFTLLPSTGLGTSTNDKDSSLDKTYGKPINWRDRYLSGK